MKIKHMIEVPGKWVISSSGMIEEIKVKIEKLYYVAIEIDKMRFGTR